MPTCRIISPPEAREQFADAAGAHIAASIVKEREQSAALESERLREAARLGIADIENGDYHTFTGRDELKRHLTSMTEQVILGR